MSSLGKKGRMFYKDLGGEHHQSRLVLGVKELFLHVSSHCSHSLILSGGMERNSYWLKSNKTEGGGTAARDKDRWMPQWKIPKSQIHFGLIFAYGVR